MYVQNQRNKRCCQAAAGHDQRRTAERLVEPRARDPVTFPRALLLEQLRKHGALLKSRGASKGVASSIVPLLWNAQLEVELRQGEMGRETVRLKFGRLL